MSFYLVKYEGGIYANDELFWTAVAGGQRAFIKMLSAKKVGGVHLMDQTIYPLTKHEQEKCGSYGHTFQDFDSAFRYINKLPGSDVKDLRRSKDTICPGARLIELPKTQILQLFKYRQLYFFKVRDYKNGNKYRMVPKMATVQLYGRLYVALNAVNVRVEAPIVVTVKE
jgi:hypothetical protein